MRGSTAGCLLASALTLASVRPQERPIDLYRQIVERFRTSPSAAIERMLSMSETDIDDSIREATRSSPGWTPEMLDAAMLLHTSTALSTSKTSADRAWTHIYHARDLGDLAARPPENSWFVHQWYTAVTVAFRHDGRVGQFREQWRQQGWYEDAAALDRARALELQGSSAPASLAARTGVEMYDPPEFMRAIPPLEQAIRGHLLVAAVHLGRIHMLRGQDARARRALEMASADSRSKVTRYFADLFLGAMDERNGHPAAAEERYRAALTLLPHAQSGRLALAALLARRGRSEDARSLLVRSATESGSLTFDPWWTYLPPDKPDFVLILGELYAEVRL